jgi:hypothetical protein
MRNLRVGTVLGVLLITSVIARADHNSPQGSVGRLSYESQELLQVVRYVGLNYQVQQSVERFNYDVSRLVDCTRFYGGGRGPDLENKADRLNRPELRDHLNPYGVPIQCRESLKRARWTFRGVERYLRDTNYDLPQVYRQYLETRDALFDLQVGGGVSVPGPVPGPGMGQTTCVAVDMGWEEHSRGHLGFGRTAYDAQRMAILECQRFHNRCRVRECR